MNVTREGKRFILATALLALAAFNTGNNLTCMILAMMLSIIVVSVITLVINLRSLSLSVSADGPVYAGQEADIEITVSNMKRLLPSYSLRIKFPKGITGESKVVHVGASSSTKVECRVLFEKRGIYKWGDFKVESSFPFIFLTRTTKVSVSGAVVVYPEIRDVDCLHIDSGTGQSSYSLRPGRGEDLLAIRDFREGDDVKLISWKASAKSQGIMVRELAEEQPLTVNIIIDDDRPFDPEAFEHVVSYAASLTTRLIEEGFYVGITTGIKKLPYGRGPEQLYRILDMLAAIKETNSSSNILNNDPNGTNVLVMKSRASQMKRFGADMVVYAAL